MCMGTSKVIKHAACTDVLERFCQNHCEDVLNCSEVIGDDQPFPAIDLSAVVSSLGIDTSLECYVDCLYNPLLTSVPSGKGLPA